MTPHTLTHNSHTTRKNFKKRYTYRTHWSRYIAADTAARSCNDTQLFGAVPEKRRTDDER